MLGGGGRLGAVMMLLGPLGVAVGAGCAQLGASSSDGLEEQVAEFDGCVVSGLAACASENWLVTVHVLTKRATAAAAMAQRSARRAARRPGLLPPTATAIPGAPAPALASVTSPTGRVTQLKT